MAAQFDKVPENMTKVPCYTFFNITLFLIIFSEVKVQQAPIVYFSHIYNDYDSMTQEWAYHYGE